MRTVFILPILFVLTLMGCQPHRIAQSSDYHHFLNDTPGSAIRSLLACNEELSFWETRLEENPGNYVDKLEIAGLLANRFKVTGQIHDIQRSDSLYWQVNQSLGREQSATTYQSLGMNAIAQHQFRYALACTQQATRIGNERYTTLLLSFDVEMELGNYRKAARLLTSMPERQAFDYLIRLAKYQDHKGDQEKAIETMEQAYDKVKDNPTLTCWILSNLGDMYGHAGRVEDSYQAYLKVLKLDPNYFHVWKGIAWIAYAHDRNTAEAKRIIRYIQSKVNMPDLDLMLAQIAETEGDLTGKKQVLKRFTTEVSNPAYRDMFNKYLSTLHAETFGNYEQAIHIANIEIKNRPTPQSYDLLAWSYCQQGKLDKALTIAQDYVEDQTYEPVALYHLGVIYRANNQKEKGRGYLEKALNSSFELGPVTTAKIETALSL
jgi:tetratricopeptide (TPR) repeat protein